MRICAFLSLCIVCGCGNPDVGKFPTSETPSKVSAVDSSPAKVYVFREEEVRERTRMFLEQIPAESREHFRTYLINKTAAMYKLSVEKAAEYEGADAASVAKDIGLVYRGSVPNGGPLGIVSRVLGARDVCDRHVLKVLRLVLLTINDEASDEGVVEEIIIPYNAVDA